MYIKDENGERRTQEERRSATRRAGVTRGAMYHHFEDKRDLFRAVVEEVEEEVDELVLAEARWVLEDTSSRWEAFRVGHRAYLDVCLRPDVRRILLLDGPTVLGWEEWHEIDASHAVRLIRAGLEAMMASGMIECGPTGPLAHLLHGAVLEAALYVAVTEDPASARD